MILFQKALLSKNGQVSLSDKVNMIAFARLNFRYRIRSRMAMMLVFKAG